MNTVKIIHIHAYEQGAGLREEGGKDFLNYNSLLTPDTNVFGLGPGARSIDMTSALWP